MVSLLSSAWALGYLLNPRQQKTRHIAVTGLYNLKPGNVVVPTAVESHSEMLHSLCVGSRCARPTYVIGVDVSVLIAHISLFFRRKKARLFLVGLSTI